MEARLLSLEGQFWIPGYRYGILNFLDIGWKYLVSWIQAGNIKFPGYRLGILSVLDTD